MLFYYSWGMIVRVLGIVVEYNPFHRGHEYHLKKAKEMVRPDYTVAVMSGNFTQRGEPAIVDKFSRTEMALRMGVDLVVELPFVYAVQDAGGFARGAIGILHKMGLVTDIVFGSESGDEKFISEIARVLHEQPEEYRYFLKIRLKEGHSFPNARKYALMDYVEKTGILDVESVRNIEKSDDILGVEYIRSILDYGSKIEFHTVKRVGADYRDESFRGEFSSATAIRRMVRERNFENVKLSVPKECYEILERELREGRGPVLWEDMEMMVMSRLRLMDRKDFEDLYGFSEGLDKRFWRFSREAGSMRELIEKIKSKRFTFSRIRRLIIYSLFGVKRELILKSNELGPQYIRVLGFNSKGRELLSEIKRISQIPLISTPSLYKKVLEKLDEDRHVVDGDLYTSQFELDVKATNVYSLMFKKPELRKGEMDFKRKVIVI